MAAKVTFSRAGLTEIDAMNHNPQCILCEGSKFKTTPYFYVLNGKRREIIRCSLCGLGKLEPMPTPQEVSTFYSVEYFERDYHCGLLSRPYEMEIENLRREMRPLLSVIQRYRSNGTYLEIGCAGGAMLAEARDRGYKTVGVELAEHMASWGRTHLQLDIRSGTLHAQRFPDHSFDVVFLGDVIEHIPAPKELLREVHRVLKPAGVLALAFPMELNSLTSRVRSTLKLQRQSPHKPYHLYYYDLGSMRRLLAQCGFEVREERADKILRKESLPTLVVDGLNYAVTRLFRVAGDRGFTLATRL